ncbi:MAG: ThuA domain-containing protein [Filimonas sp.]|nr:ThuA domain-containing protein [Filimonas sp.]
MPLKKSISFWAIVCACLLALCHSPVLAQKNKSKFSVIGFYTAKSDLAHISFVHEANKWFSQMAQEHHFTYDSTNDWSNMNPGFLAKYKVVLFLDTRPEDSLQRVAFQQYMEKGGAWMGFHFSAFALTPSAYPQNWDWYHKTFLGSDQYGSNTWRPTSAVLTVENKKYAFTKNMPDTFSAAPNEWYRWSGDLKANPDIDILLSINPVSFPLGTGPKQHEIWHSGYYPVAWKNKHYKMVYINMGHNDMDYGKTNQSLSSTFSSKWESNFILNGLLWLGK